MTQTNYDANDVLMGGSGSPAWKFDEPGTTREGIIASPPQAKQEREYDKDNPGGGALKFFPSGDPIMGVVVEVQTTERTDHEDDGKRTFYIEGRYIKEAVRTAVRTAGARGLEVGGTIRVTFTHREDPMDKRSRKFWTVSYTPAGNAALMSDPTPRKASGVCGADSPFGQENSLPVCAGADARTVSAPRTRTAWANMSARASVCSASARS